MNLLSRSFPEVLVRAWFTFVLMTILGCQAAVNPADAAKIAEVIAFEKEMEAAVLRGDGKLRKGNSGYCFAV